MSFDGAKGSGATGTAQISPFFTSSISPTYNEVTGLGTPIANRLIPDLVTSPVTEKGLLILPFLLGSSFTVQLGLQEWEHDSGVSRRKPSVLV